MKVYKVKVNGKVYEVELESVSEQAGSVVAAQPVQQTESAPRLLKHQKFLLRA